jgi:hypothetical protein
MTEESNRLKSGMLSVRVESDHLRYPLGRGPSKPCPEGGTFSEVLLVAQDDKLEPIHFADVLETSIGAAIVDADDTRRIEILGNELSSEFI